MLVHGKFFLGGGGSLIFLSTVGGVQESKDPVRTTAGRTGSWPDHPDETLPRT